MLTGDYSAKTTALGVQAIANRISRSKLFTAFAITCAAFTATPAVAQSAARFVCVYNNDQTSNNSAAVQARLCVDSGATCGSWQRDTVSDGMRTIFWREGDYSNAYYEVEAQSGGLGCNNGPCASRTQIRAGHIQSYEMSDLTPNGNWVRFCRRAEATFCGTSISSTGTC